MKLTRETALKIREMLIKSASEMDDAEASKFPEFFPRLNHDGSNIPAGTRVYWNGVLKKVIEDIQDTVERNPDNSESLWEDVQYDGGYRIIPNNITLPNVFAKGEKGMWKGKLYTSLYGSNEWNPEQFPAGWSKEE